MATKDPVAKEVKTNVETAEEDKDVKCDNHPSRKGRNFHGGAYSINLCDECTPPWFKDQDVAL